MKTCYQLVFLLLFTTTLFGTPFFQREAVELAEEEVYLSLRYQGVIDEIVVAYYTGEDFFLPLTELFDIFSVNYEFDPAELSVSGFFLQEKDKYIVDFNGRKAMVGERPFSLDVNDFMIKELDFFLKPELFKELFGIELIVDISRLSIRIETKHILPIVARHTQRYRQELRSRSNTAGDEFYELLMDRDTRVLDGALFDYSLFSTVTSERQQAAMNFDVGGEVLYGDLQGTVLSSVNQDTGSVTGTNIRWRYANDMQPWFSTVTVGQQSSVGLTNQTFQGIGLTNQSLIPKRSYDSYMIDGSTDPEAEVELYQDGHLLEVVEADDVGYYRFMIPLNYGTSEFKLRIYGKQGRVIELERRIQIPFQFLPVGELRYHLSGGRIASEELKWEDQPNMSTASLAWGMTNWLTGSLGAEYFEGSNYDRPSLNAKLSSRLFGDMLVNLDAAIDNYYSISMRGVGPNTSSFSLDHTLFNQKNIYNPLGMKHNMNVSLFYPFNIGDIRFSGRSSFSWVNIEDENQYRLYFDVNQFMRGLRIRYAVKERHDFSPSRHDISSEFILGGIYLIPRIPSIHPILRGSYFRADLTYNSFVGQAEELEFQYIRQFTSKLKAQLLSSYNLIQESVFLEVGLTWDLDVIRSSSTVRTIRSIPSFTQTLRGSAGFDRVNGEIIWDNRQQVGRSGVSVRMYEDANNSKTYDLDERIIPGNALTIERSSSRLINKSGITRMTQLQPYRRYNFRVNEAKVNNPLLVPSIPKFSVVTDPNRYKRIDVPFYTTGVIEGSVYRRSGDGFTPVSGLRIHVRPIEGGDELILRTFADGSYYSMEIPPGEYECWVDESQLEFLGAIANPSRLEFLVISSSEGDFIEGLNFTLE